MDTKLGRLVGAGLVLAVALGVAGLVGSAHACVRVPLVATGFDDVVVCTEDGEDADGTVAVSLYGDARASGELPLAAVSGTGNADRSIVCASGSGRAGGPHSDFENQCTVSVSVAGSDADEDRPASSAFLVAVSGSGTARAPVAVSVFGDSRAQLVSVSGTGHAGGDTYSGDHPAPYVAVSGCSAEHSDHSDADNGQFLVVDPTGVHVDADPDGLFDPDRKFEPTDISTGAVGPAVQAFTCGVDPTNRTP